MAYNLDKFYECFGILLSVSEQLNEIARVESIPEGRADIWDVIHNLTEEEWFYLFEGLDWFKNQGAFSESDERVIADVYDKWKRATMLGNDWVGFPNDINPATGKKKKSGHKHEIWSMWMRIREIVNRQRGVYIPNGPQSTTPPKKAANTFQEIFQ